MKTSAEIRSTFLRYFSDRQHIIVPSSSLIPGNDPTLLFTNAGMVQFKDVFLGTEKRAYRRATSSQKCMRVSGKHNDLENVGPSPRHHTFFEMLGNFSFGDYFKRDAVAYAWEFMTEVLGLDKSRLYPTVYQEDDEALQLWHDVAGIPLDRITRMGKKDNFWAMGDTGPNGPCSELHYDRGKQYCTCGRPDCGLTTDCERWWELWNLVFMQYETSNDGTTHNLPRPSIDTGMGMERITAVLQGKDSNYETDLFWPIIMRTQTLLGHTDAQRDQQMVSYRVVADHARAIAFLIADGVLPGNEGRNYVLRLILRRAARHGKLLGFKEPFLSQVLQVVIENMGSHYTELIQRRGFILEATTREEERFLQTLDTGLTLLDQIISQVKRSASSVISGEAAFRLYDTYGFPLDLTRDVAKEQGLTVDEAGFRSAMEAQRARARSTQVFEAGRDDEFYRSLTLPTTRFTGYETTESTGRVLALIRNHQTVAEANTGDDVGIILDGTPFYAESGGQVGDTGVISNDHGIVEVRETRHPLPDLTVHLGTVKSGSIGEGDDVHVTVTEDVRLDTARNHTSTHLLHRALQSVLGDHARQAGSLVAPDRLRFDFTHLSPISADELVRIESEVNAAVRRNLPVATQLTTYNQAREQGAMALFGEKYGDTVRMVTIGDSYSCELCGGTHLTYTGQIGLFHIISESSIGSGLRRIEAVTGRGAEAYVRAQLKILSDGAALVGTRPDSLLIRLQEMTEQLRLQQKDVDALRRRIAGQDVERLLGSVQMVGTAPLLAAKVEADSVERMREMIDQIRPRLSAAVIVLGSVVNGRPLLVTAVAPELVAKGIHAGRLVGQLARVVGGGGGGQATMAQAGGRDASRLDEALANAAAAVEASLQEHP